MNIEVYSIKSFSGNVLKSMLETAISELNLPYKVTEVNNVDDFLKAGLTSVPAVRVGNQVIEHNEEKPFETTVRKAMDLILHKGSK